MQRIAVAGIQHETNTFSSMPTTMAHFIEADAWPGLTQGEAVLAAVAGANLPLAGAVAALEAGGLHVLPLLWASANPSGRVEDAVFEALWAMFEAALLSAGPLDGVYLDLHGALVTERYEDGDGEWLRRTRALLGDQIPIVASLDFHANVSPLMVNSASALVGYRSYPHVDMAETGARAVGLLQQLLAGEPLHSAFVQLPFLISMPWQCSLIEPVARLMYAAEQAETGDILSVSFFPGFPLADVADGGPSILAYAKNTCLAETTAQALAQKVLAAEPEFAGRLWQVDEALSYARQYTGQGKTIILADTCDNAGGGAGSDAAGIISDGLKMGMPAMVVGILCDPATAQAAHSAGVGGVLLRAIGQGRKASGEWRVISLGTGQFAATGPFYAGCQMDLGPMACLQYQGLTVLVSSRKQQAADQAMFRHLGVEPDQAEVLVLKSSVHFRADFGAIASEILVVEAEGDHVADLSRLQYRVCKRRPASRDK
ncbi:M81 family metallopeptidase [Iodobacter sp. HSC-16F04]|uniref:Microcystinase C n=1 Tax=Iodobacter violaceini TaxID=3044271 RepID=A0ABX0KTR0_9NEIS|nr:M81 family metallopeptidase [Iodobacter violacea]NHQ85740.1 M81 family metallopeptidase [Iodobacter violacea]